MKRYNSDVILPRKEKRLIALPVQMEKSTSHCYAPSLTGLVEDKLIEAIQPGYDAIRAAREAH